MSCLPVSAPAADASDVFLSTRQNYERFAFLLLRNGHVPGLALSHLELRVLLFLLGQKPGHYAAHHRTIAAACESNTTSIRQALVRLRGAGLVGWTLIPPHHLLPSGRYARTNVNCYRVRLEALGALLEAPRPPATFRAPRTSTRPKSDASSRTVSLCEPMPPSPSPPEHRPKTLRAKKSEEEALSPRSRNEEPENLAVREAWEKLGLGRLDDRSLRALSNRRAEGATEEQLLAAVAGAGDDDWIRRRAKVPFAVVFASLASLERFAHQGRKRLGGGPALEPLQWEQGREEGTGTGKPAASESGGERDREGDPPARPVARRGLGRLDPPLGGPPLGAWERGEAPVWMTGPEKRPKTKAPPDGGFRAHTEAETPESRRREAQEAFDQRRQEALAALRAFE